MIDLSTASWRKSSYSGNTNDNCVEVAENFPGAASWRKSSYSGSEPDNCLEVADTEDTVPVRDSKSPERPVLLFSSAAWSAFIARAKQQ